MTRCVIGIFLSLAWVWTKGLETKIFLIERGQELKKINVVLFSVFCLGLTLYSVLLPGYYQQFLISSTNGLFLIRFMICAGLLIYVFRPQLRTYFAQALLRASGWTLLLFGISTFISPGFFGHSVSYVPIADTFILLEGGVLALLLSIELPAHEPTAKNKSLQYFASLLVTQPKKLTRSAARANSR